MDVESTLLYFTWYHFLFTALLQGKVHTAYKYIAYKIIVNNNMENK